MPDSDPNRQHRPRGGEILRWDEIPSTRWTLVGRAGAAKTGDPLEARSALDELLRLYLPVLRGHLVMTLRLPADKADDLLQGFLADRVLEKNLIGQADAKRGRFRRFLLIALNSYVADAHRRGAAAKRRPSGGAPVSLEDIADPPASSPTAAEQFDRLWANEVLGEVMRRTRYTCKTSDRMVVWAILEARILLPVTAGAPPAPHAALAQQHGLEGAEQSANLLAAGKQLFTQVFRAVVAEYQALARPADSGDGQLERAIDEEIRDLWTIFAAPRR